MAFTLSTPYYHQLIRKYHTAFGSMFKQMTLVRTDANGVESQRINMPIEYAAREAWLTRLRAEPTLAQTTREIQPRLAYEMTAVRYDPSRKLNSLNSRACGPFAVDRNTAHRYFSGVPYIMSMSLYVLTRSVDDANQLLEQILPTFAPDHQILVNLIPSLGIMDRMRIVMDSAPQWVDSWEADAFTKTRQIIQTFNFNVAVTFFGPIPSTPASIIRKVIVDLYDSPFDADLVSPVYLMAATRDRLAAEDDFHLIDESSISDLRDLARIVRMVIEPDPIDALPVKPVDSTTTITDYVDGRVANPSSGEDEEL